MSSIRLHVRRGVPALLADLQRSLAAVRSDDGEELLRELELRLDGGSASRTPVLSRTRLFDELAPAVREAWPGAGEELLLELQWALWPAGVVTTFPAFDPDGRSDGADLDLEPDSFPGFVVEKGRLRGLRVLLHRDSMVLGGCPRHSDISLAGHALAAAHLRVTLDARDQVFLEDVSEEGLLVNGKRAHETWLSDRDAVGCGELLLRFVAARG